MSTVKSTLPSKDSIEIIFFISGYYQPEAGIFSVDADSDPFLGFVPNQWQQPHFIDSLIHPDDMQSWSQLTAQGSEPGTKGSRVLRIKDASAQYCLVTLQLTCEVPSNPRLLLSIQSFPKIEQAIRYSLSENLPVLVSEQANHYLNIVGVIIFTLDKAGCITLLNRFACRLLGVTHQEAIGLNWFDCFIPEADRDAARLAFSNLMKGEHAPNQEVERPIVNSRGKTRLIRWYNQVLTTAEGDRYGILSSGTDITEQRQSEQALAKAEERSRLLLENSKEGIFGIDLDGLITFINPAAINMLGFSFDELILQDGHALFHHSDRLGRKISADECMMLSAARDDHSYRVDSDVLWRKDGSCFPVEYWSSPIKQQDKIIGSVVTFHDITHRKQAEEQIRYLAFHDALTGLPNRRLFQDRFEHELLLNRRSGHICALHMMDIDHFKEINDTRGHPVGDALLVEVSRRISKLLRAEDTFARLGGDEFAILQSDVRDPVDVAAMAEKIIQCFSVVFELNSHVIKTSISSGVVVCDKDLSVDEWISRGDIALYRAKENGRSCYAFYQSEMTDLVKRDAELAHLLGSAQIRQQLYVEYQPQYSCRTRALEGGEALLRWRHPEQKIISPQVFIAIAEKRGMIDDIGLWVAQQVCNDASRWFSNQLEFGRISFNLSPVQLRSEEGMKALLQQVDESKVPLSCFEIEITESAYMDASPQTLALLDSYVSEGMGLAIDDFGTGYSSLVALRKLSVSRLKIDQSFVKDMLLDPNEALIVSATVSLGHALGLNVVAEGVETEEQLEKLCSLGCDSAQGYYLNRPMSAECFESLLQQKKQ